MTQVRPPARYTRCAASREPAPTRAAAAYQRPADPGLRLSGSITARATPFTAAGELDLDAWRDLLQAQRLAGTQAVVVAGSTGEAAALFNTEYDALLRAAVEELGGHLPVVAGTGLRSEEHTSALQSLMRISYAVFCLKKKKAPNRNKT